MNRGEQIDDISTRMVNAYCERRKHPPGSPEYNAADAAIEAVYEDLRKFNEESAAEIERLRVTLRSTLARENESSARNVERIIAQDQARRDEGGAS